MVVFPEKALLLCHVGRRDGAKPGPSPDIRSVGTN